MLRALAIAYLCTGSLALVGVWVGLPDRWWPVDLVATLLALLLWVAGIGLLLGKPWAGPAARAVTWGVLCAGLGLTAILTWTAAHLAGLYGPVGGGGALLLATLAALIVPYFVALPLLGLVVLRRARGRAERDAR